MNTGPHRDRMLDAHLRRSLARGADAPAADGCLDAETLAAWLDGGLAAAAAAMAESHVASCTRCQGMVGVMAHATPAETAPGVEPWWQRFRVGWLVPLAAGMAAVVLWTIVPSERAPAPVPPESTQARAEAPVAKAEQAAPSLPKTASARPQSEPAKAVDAGKNELKKDQSAARSAGSGLRLADPAVADEKRSAERVQAAPAAAPPPAVPPAAERQAVGRMIAQAPATEVASPDPAIRWRVNGARVERTSDGGATWEPAATGGTAILTAGAAPSPGVCWLVGRGGTILRTIDGRSWQRVAFPEPVDLIGIQATDARTAAVTTADGRTLRTVDGGVTWTGR